MNPNISRWTTASLAELLRPIIATTLSMQFFVEGVDREQREWFQADSCVLRVVGPKWYPQVGQDIYRFEATVMLTDLPDDAANAFVNYDRLGTIATALSNPIPVFQYGNGGDDSQVGCLDIDPTADEAVRIVQFGKLDPNSEVVQAAVIVRYEICLDS